MNYDNSAAWAAAAQTASTAAGVIAQSNVNRKTQKWNEKIMAQQREWSLADWNMNNQYNSPAAQMERLKAAGLNPNLIYGSGANNVSQPVRSTDSPSWNPKAPDMSGFGSVMSSYVDLQARQQQTQLLKTQNVIAEREAQLKATQDLLMQAQITKLRWDTDLSQSMAPYNTEMKKAQIRQLDQNILESGSRITNMTGSLELAKYAGIRDEQRLRNEGQRLGMEKGRFASDMSTAELQRDIMEVSKSKGMADIQLSYQQIDNLMQTEKAQKMLNQLQENLGRTGLTNNDPALYKVYFNFLKELVGANKK